MKCPACSNDLKQVTANNVNVDVCENGCGGIWFDQLEIIKFDEPSEPADELLHISTNSNIKLDYNKRLKCPKDSSIMMRHFFSVKRKITVDECPKCAGYWLDAGELRN